MTSVNQYQRQYSEVKTLGLTSIAKYHYSKKLHTCILFSWSTTVDLIFLVLQLNITTSILCIKIMLIFQQETQQVYCCTTVKFYGASVAAM